MHYTKSTPTGMPLGLLDNFKSMMALAEAGTLTEEKARRLKNIIQDQIQSAETVALSICPKTQPELFLNARQVLGFGDELQEHTIRNNPHPKLSVVQS